MTPFLQTRFEGEDPANEAEKKSRRKAEVQSRLPSGNPPGEMSNARRNLDGRADGRGCMDVCGRADAGDVRMSVRTCFCGCSRGFFLFLSSFLFFFVRPRVSWGFLFFREYCFCFNHLPIDSNFQIFLIVRFGTTRHSSPGFT